MGNELKVSFLDIGQGDSILIETPHGRRVLIDGGPGVTLLERLGESLSFWDSHFDMVILGHPDLDHLEGLVDVLDRFEVDRIMMSGVYHSSALYRHFQNQVAEQVNAEIVFPNPDEDWILDEGVVFDVIYPDEPMLFEQHDHLNDTSVSGILKYGESTMLLTGDLEEDGEKQLLLSDIDLRAQVFKAGHHGSRTSSIQEFVRAIQPELMIVTAGRDNQFDHPHLDKVLEFDEAGIEWISTKELGTIRMVSDGVKWTVQN